MTMTPFAKVFALAVLGLGGASLRAQAPVPDLKDPVALLKTARATNGLDGDDLKPWHLKANYELFDDNGKPMGTGVFEEWWAAKNKWKQSFMGNHYTGAAYRTTEGFAHEGGFLAWPEALIAGAIIAPLPDSSPQKLSLSKPKLRKESGMQLTCIEVKIQNSSRPNRGPDETYCFDEGTPKLRLIGSPFVSTFFNQFGTFHGRNTGVQMTIYVNGHLSAKVRVDSLADDLTMQPEALKPPVSAIVNPVHPEGLTPAMIPPKLISAVDPKLPNYPTKDVRSGIVVVGVTVDEHGTVTYVHVLESPTTFMANAAMEAVRAYKFEAARRSGQPVAVEVSIGVEFHVD